MIEILCKVQYIWCAIAAMISLSRWYCCEDECLMRFLLRNMLLRLFVNMCVSTQVVCMVLMAINIMLSYARRMFWCLGNLLNIWVLLLVLYTLDLVT